MIMNCNRDDYGELHPGGVAELNDQPTADQPLLLKPPRIILGNTNYSSSQNEREISFEAFEST